MRLSDSEYNEKFDELRKNRVAMSFHKYGPAKANFSTGNVNALKSAELCQKKYEETGNTEYLVDMANYVMFEFMYPQHENAHFKETRSEETAGIHGMSVAEAERIKNNTY